jgi:hypothetical protein
MRSPLLVVFATALLGAACGKNIGDACKTNVDCSLQGDRFCDTASPGGYCTVEGCDYKTCPTDDSICIRFFTAVIERSCVFGQGAGKNGCRIDERCVCDHSVEGLCGKPCDGNAPAGQTGCGTGQTCICDVRDEQDTCTRAHCDPPDAHCAPESSERRWCMDRCGSNGDCRDGYECRPVGTHGTEPVPVPDGGTVDRQSFCVARGQLF